MLVSGGPSWKRARLAEKKEDLAKVRFMRQADSSTVPWEKEVKVPQPALDAVDWLAARSSEQATAQRAVTLSKIRKLAQRMRDTGTLLVVILCLLGAVPNTCAVAR